MRLLKEIFRWQGLRCRQPVNPNGRAITRQAVRGIILDGDQVLMVYSAQNGDYKFPGGGVEAGESQAEALRREILEECGANITGPMQPFGRVIEYDLPIEPEYDVFQMTSYYYLCQVEGVLGNQNLDAYEQDLGFTPRWVSIDHAIQCNAAQLQADLPNLLPWAKRELFVLELVKAGLITHEDE
ncbi:MAG TPA: NUDIX domain-containing protein [Anaerolineales bacterium]|nr:NUDIX domain-containing protein [Anaerolineales bacterium]